MISEIELIVRIVLAAAFGAIVGIERERVDRPAGLRTHMLVSLGAAQFTILSFYAFPGSDPSRIASVVVVGIGFIGAGTIIQSRGRITGVTTAASLWVAASIGMSLGIGFYLASVVVTALSFLILRLKRVEEILHKKRKKRK